MDTPLPREWTRQQRTLPSPSRRSSREGYQKMIPRGGAFDGILVNLTGISIRMYMHMFIQYCIYRMKISLMVGVVRLVTLAISQYFLAINSQLSIS